MLGSSDMLEDEFRPQYEAWKKTPGPETNAAMLKLMTPHIEGAVRTHVGETNPLILGRARVMALQALPTYDPKRGRLQTHVYSHLQGLKRENRKQTTIFKVPERVQFDKYHLDAAEQELTHLLGRGPSDEELADFTGFSPKRMAKVRGYQPGMAEGTAEDGNIFGGLRSVQNPTRTAWADLVYQDLDPYHQKVMELAMGLNGRKPLSNNEIAAKLKRSPGAISQAKARIQSMLDQEAELSPFSS